MVYPYHTGKYGKRQLFFRIYMLKSADNTSGGDTLKTKKRKKTQLPKDLLRRLDLVLPGSINTDPFGSYTGRPTGEVDLPVQDVDDL